MGKKLVPNYEVKLLLKPEVVLKKDNNGQLTTQLDDKVLQEFKVKGEPIDMSIQFIDTKTPQTIQDAGWNLRIRKSADKKSAGKFGLTWKKRVKIDVNQHPDPADNIAVAVDTANKEGFDFDKDAGFEPQVEVGYKAQTLSISYNDDISDEGYSGMALPEIEHSCKVLLNNAPPQFNTWAGSVSAQGSGSSGPLAGAVVYGPVNAKRYVGEWNDDKLYIEVWPIRTSRKDSKMELVVEASFKTEKTNKAMKGRDKLAEYLDGKHWFKPEDSLKTGMIMDRYPPDA